MPPTSDPSPSVLGNWLERAPAVLVTVSATEGSAPREVGAWMAVQDDAVIGSVGGGHLEFEAIAHARALLAGEPVARERRFALGPSLGQCCGGVVRLGFERIERGDAFEAARRMEGTAQAGQMPVALFGGGHVGRAIVNALAPLPARVHWIDSRDEVFPADLPPSVRAEHSQPVEAAVRDLEPGSRVLVMSFSHAEDLEVVAACLRRLRERDDLPFVGLIGSRSKRAAFGHRLEARGFTAQEIARITSPIGVPGVVGKEPAVIAAAVVAQLLQTR